MDLKVDLRQDSLAKPRGSLRLGKMVRPLISAQNLFKMIRHHPTVTFLVDRSALTQTLSLSGPRLPIIHSIKKYRPAPVPLRKFQQPRRAPLNPQLVIKA